MAALGLTQIKSRQSGAPAIPYDVSFVCVATG
jgi:hypothetical protein